MAKQLLVGLVLVGVLAGAPLHGQAGTDSARVYAVAAGIVAADNETALERVLAYYADDAVLMPPNSQPVRDTTAIRPRYEALFRDYRPAIESIIDEVVVRGDLAIVRGRNGGWLRGRTGVADRPLNDVYLMVLRRSGDGEWRITRLIWHSATP
jgi:uncharacterized protein (TIGR02246 family)